MFAGAPESTSQAACWYKLPGRGDVGRHVGQHVPDRLLVADRLPELHPLLAVGQRVLERAAGQADRAGRGLGAGDVQPAQAVLEALALLLAGVLQGVGGQPQPVELELPGGQAEVADLVDRGAGDAVGEAAALLLDEEQLEAVGGAAALARRPGPGEQVQEVGGAGVTDPALGAGDDPLVPVAYGGALGVRQVGAGVGLGERDRPDPPAGRALAAQLEPPGRGRRCRSRCRSRAR